MLTDEVDAIDIVKRMRTNIATLDDTYIQLNKLSAINDLKVHEESKKLTEVTMQLSQRLALLLQEVEKCKPYRDIVKRYRIEDTVDDV